jgi:hypothetical protein
MRLEFSLLLLPILLLPATASPADSSPPQSSQIYFDGAKWLLAWSDEFEGSDINAR